jgi:hypothetical protein
MAKVSFTKLGLKVNQEIKTIKFNEQDIEVKQYLPVNEKLELMSNVINAAADDNSFANPSKVEILTLLEICYHYTNINFTDKQKEDVAKLYDLIFSSNLGEMIFDALPDSEYNFIQKGIQATINSIYEYKSSVMGILEAVTENYKDLEFNANDIY